MTLANLKIRLDIEKARGNSEQVKIIEEMIAKREPPKPVVETKSKVKKNG